MKGVGGWASWSGLTILLLLSVGSPGLTAEGLTKVGFVDLERVVDQSKKGQAALAKLRAEANQKEKEILASEEEIKRLEGELQKERSLLSESAIKERIEVIDRKKRDHNRLIDDSRRDLAKRQRELEIELQKEIFSLIREYGREKGYTLIVEGRQGGVLYGSEAADLTREIIERFDRKRP